MPPNKTDPVEFSTRFPVPAPIIEVVEVLTLLSIPPTIADNSDPDTKFPLPTPIKDLLEDSI